MSTPESTSTALVTFDLPEAKKLALITAESVSAVKATYLPHFTTFLELEKQAKEVSVNAPQAAHKMQMALRKVRTGADKDRKTLNENARLYVDAVNEVYNLLEARVTPIEERMESIAKAEKIAAQEKANALKVKRLAELTPFGQDNTFYDLANLPEMQYQQLLGSQKVAFDTRQAELAKAEADKVAAEQARLKREANLAAENKRLADEAAKKQKALDDAKRAADEIAKKAADALKVAEAEKAKLKADADARLAAQAKAASDKAAKEKADRDAADKAAQAKRDAAEKVAQAERDRIKAEQDKATAAALAKANEATRLAFEEAKKLAEAEQVRQAALRAKVIAEREAQAKADVATDAEKVLVFARAIEAVQIPTLSTNQDLTKKLIEQTAKMVKWLRSEAAKV